MMFTHKNLMTVCCAAVLAFGLAACGGGGGGGDEMAAGTGTDNGTGQRRPVLTPEEIAAATKAAKTKLDAIGEIEANWQQPRLAALAALYWTADHRRWPDGSYDLSVTRDRMARR